MEIEDIFKNIPNQETKHLILRKIKKEDVDDMFEYSSNPQVTKFLSYLHTNKQQTADYINNKIAQYESGNCMIWGIEHKEDKKYIGACGYTHWDTNNHIGELAYTFNQNYWSRGLASEIMELLIHFGFYTMQLNRIEAICWTENVKSYKLMEKFDLQYEGTIRERLFVKNHFEDVRIYALLKKDYERRKKVS